MLLPATSRIKVLLWGGQTIQDMEHIATVAMKWELPTTILDLILTSAEWS
jgi:hypothetical protein